MASTKYTHSALFATIVLVLSLALAMSNLFVRPARVETTYNVTIFDFALDSTTYNVTISAFAFAPQVLCIEKGDTVNWTNNDPVIYTLWFVFAENGSTYLLSDPILPSKSWSHTFTEPQKFTLLQYSFERLWITGTVRVYRIFGDIDGDGDVDPDDFAVFAGAYGTAPPSNPDCDLDGDDDIDPDDFAIFAGKYGQTDP